MKGKFRHYLSHKYAFTWVSRTVSEFPVTLDHLSRLKKRPLGSSGSKRQYTGSKYCKVLGGTRRILVRLKHNVWFLHMTP